MGPTKMVKRNALVMMGFRDRRELHENKVEVTDPESIPEIGL